MSNEKTAISPTRQNDFPEWYQQVVRASDMAENSPVRGCMVIKPWGYGIWEKLQRTLDDMIKKTGHENAYFPLFIPLSYLEREAKHVEGFAKECAVITHHRLEERGGKLIPTGELEEPLIVRPTSETIIGESFSRWVESWRDLPLLINQWANVVRWEMRPRIFLRTTEFLWQEGHTVHATEAEAVDESCRMLEMYRRFLEETLAIPVIAGEKSPAERFPGAVTTYTLEAMMQDTKALQTCTSHYLGQNFSKGFNIRFSNPSGDLEYGYTTSWGMTTRIIGAMIMCHGDDNGLCIPPRASHKQIVIIPVTPDATEADAVLQEADRLADALRSVHYHGVPLEVIVDKRDRRGGEKKWEWIKKGIPVRIEIGPKDLISGQAVLYRRDEEPNKKHFEARASLVQKIAIILDEIQSCYYSRALKMRDANLVEGVKTFEELREIFAPKNENCKESHGGFVRANWCGDEQTEGMLTDLKVSIRCLPLNQKEVKGKCVLTGRPAVYEAIFAKSY